MLLGPLESKKKIKKNTVGGRPMVIGRKPHGSQKVGVL